VLLDPNPVEEIVNRKVSPSFAALRWLPLSLLSVCVMLLLGACSFGPFDFNNGTPVPTQPLPTATVAVRPISGQVLDADTGKPIESAEITAAGVLTATSPTGDFYFPDVPAGSKISIVAEGYKGAEVDAGQLQKLPPVQLKADKLTGRVTDATTGKPIAGVLVKLTFPVAEPVTPTAPLTPTLDATPEITATETSTDSARLNGLSAPLQASRVPTSEDTEEEATTTSTAAPPTATPKLTLIPPVGEGFVAVYTNENGEYLFNNAPPGSTLTFKMPGYKLFKLAVDGPKEDAALEEFRIQALYMTANIASVKDLYDELVDFAQKSMFNAVVLNVQTDASEWVFDTQNPDVVEADNKDVILPNIADTVKDLKSKGFYTIARVVTFQQKTMALARPDMAVMSSETGKPWRGGYAAQQVWLDASNPKAQDYVISMTKEVLTLGFDEVQYDYVRFPSDPAPTEPGEMVFSKDLDTMGKVMALQGFLKKAHDTIEPTDAFMSIDVFGYTLWPDQDGVPILGSIGQVLPYLVDYSDYVSPMIYPSHFSPGEQGCSVPAKCAYTLIKKSGEFAEPIFKNARSKYRPWLQDFDWGPTDYTSPGTTKVTDQLRACEETNCWGWQMWDPANVYEPRKVFEK